MDTRATAPVSGKERVHVLDVLRGFAIFGMWIVNMTLDVGWSYRIELMPMTVHDKMAAALVQLLFSGKFFTIFSFLFGVGVFIQVERIRARGGNHVALFLRRVGGLLVIAYLAIAATARVWILVDYAVIGIALLFFVDRTPRTMLIAAVACVVVGIVPSVVVPEYQDLEELRTEARAQGITVEAAALRADRAAIERGLGREPGIRSATFVESSEVALRRSIESHTDWRYYFERLGVLSLMLVGLCVAKVGAVWDPSVRESVARRFAPWLLGVGLAATLVAWAITDLGVGDRFAHGQRIAGQALMDPIGSSAMGLGYAAVLVLLFGRGAWRRLLDPFGAVGRMALTCYLFTVLSGSFIALGWGLGMFGRMMPAAGVLVVLILFPLLALACNWWMRHFRFGPAEWVWRCMTYGRLQPLRLRRARAESPGLRSSRGSAAGHDRRRTSG